MNPYQVLGLSENSSLDDVKSAYRKLAKKYHPDVNKDPDAEKKFKEIAEAYEEITNPKPQNNYNSGNPFEGFNPFGDFFNFDIFNQRPRQINTPINLRLTLSINEVYKNIQKKLRYNRTISCQNCKGLGGIGNITVCTVCLGTGQNKRTINQGFMYIEQVLGPCETCRGKGKIYENYCNLCSGNGSVSKEENIDLNIAKGSLFKAMVFPGYGNFVDLKSNPGDLLIEIHLKNSENYAYDQNYNLKINKHIDPIVGIIGDMIKVEHPNGEILNIELPEETKNGFSKVFQNKGLPKNENEYGNLIVEFLYNTPKDLTEFEKSFLNQYIQSRKQRGIL